MGLMAFLPVLALYVEEEFGIADPQDVAMWASIIYGAGPLAAACAGPIWGAIGDRHGKKRMAVRANLAIAVTTAFMPFAPSPGWLLVARVVQGTFAGYVAPAMALGTAPLPRYVHGRVLASLQVAMATGTFLGPYLGAEIAAEFGRSSLFWAASVLSLVSAVVLQLCAVEARPSPTARQHSFLVGFWRGCTTLLSSGVFATLLVLLMILRFGQNMLEPMVALFIRELGPQALLVEWSRTEELALDRTIAVAFAVLAIGQWLCTPRWGRLADRHGPLRCLSAVCLLLFVLQGMMLLVSSINQFLLLRCMIACAMAGSMTLAFAAVSKRVAAENRTLAFSLVQSCIQLGLALGPIIGAFVVRTSDGPDFRFGFGVAAVLCGVSGVGLVVLRQVEQRRA